MQISIDKRTTRTGITLSIRILAAAASLTLAVLLSAQSDETRMRNDAIDWASDQRSMAFDTLMPAASREEVRDPVCRSTTLRSPGAIDAFEFEIRIVEACNDDRFTGEVIVAQGEPLVVQLAKLRIARPTASAADVIDELRTSRKALSESAAREIMRLLHTVEISPVASDELLIDRRRFELTSVSWTYVRLEFLDIEHRRGWRRLPKTAQSILKVAGIKEEALRWDPSALEGDDN